jgi:hypothetical protein
MNGYGSEFLKKMKLFGLMRYDFERIAVIVAEDKSEHVDAVQFERDFHSPDHPVFREYDKGRKSADFSIEKALFDKAVTGDKDAVVELENYKGRREYALHVKKMFDV